MKTRMTLLLMGFMIQLNGQQKFNQLDLSDDNKPVGVESSFSDSASVERIKSTMVNYDFAYKIPPQRPFYNQSFRVGAGYSLNTLRLDNSMRMYNDTSEHHFDVLGHSPMFSFTHTLAIDSTFSLGYSISYAQSNIQFDNQYYGGRSVYLSINPQVHILRTFNFEYYVKLKIALNYEQNNLDMIPSATLQNIYPTGFHLYTGVTIAGLNFLVSDNLALNAEFSIWSPESVSFGMSYRFFKERTAIRKKALPADIRFAY